MSLVVAVEAERTQVRPLKSPLPAALGLNRIDVVDLHRYRTAFLTAVTSVLHLGFRQPLPIGRGIEPRVLRIPLLVVAGVPFHPLLLEHLLPLLLRYGLAGSAVNVWVANERFAA